MVDGHPVEVPKVEDGDDAPSSGPSSHQLRWCNAARSTAPPAFIARLLRSSRLGIAPHVGFAGRAELAHNHPRREEMRWFEFNLPLSQPPLDNLYLRFEEGDRLELQRMVAINLQGEFDFAQQRVDLNLKTFADTVFGHGEAVIGGVRHLLVASLDNSMAVHGIHVEPDKASVTKDHSKKAKPPPKKTGKR